jgi:predicted transposase YbfD/YdcC
MPNSASNSCSTNPISQSDNPAIHLLRLGLASIADRRIQRQVRHPIGDVLLTALLALLSDAEDYVDMATFAETQLDWLQGYQLLANGAPSHDTFRYVFMLVQPSAMLEVISKWVGCLDGKHIRVDGKVNRGVKDPQTGRSRLHILRAWVGEVGLSVGQVACGDKEGEATVLPQLLDSLSLKGALVSIDAMAGHAEVAQQIHTAGGDWLLAIKGNEKGVFEHICAHFQKLCGQHATAPEGTLPKAVPSPKTLHPKHLAAQRWPQNVRRVVTEEMNRGRYERREVIVIPIGDWWPKAFLWYGIASVVCVIRTTMRQRHGKNEPTQEVHYYVTSLAPERAEEIAEKIRAHWAVENGCHYLLDVTYGEDHNAVRDPVAAQNLSIMREISAKLLKGHPLKTSVSTKRKRAALDPSFRAQVVARLFEEPHA